jgi:hypothetical protein
MSELGELVHFLQAVSGGIAAGLFLNVVYFGIQASWPENYTTIRNVIDKGARGSLVKYLLLRFLPTYVTATFTSVTLARLDRPVWPAVVALLATHLAFTNMRAVLRLWTTAERTERSISLVSYHVATSFLILATGVLALGTSGAWAPLIPRPTELTTALWTGAFAAVIAAALQKMMRFHTASPGELMVKVRADVGHQLWEEIPAIAAENDCDPELIRAIVAAESLQRPRWVRRLERWKGRLIPKGTYGVGQVSAATPLDDAESLSRLCENFRGYFPARSKWGYVQEGRFMARLEGHNENAQFQRQVYEFYQELVPHSVAKTDADAADRRPVIEVVSVKRVHQQIRISGTAAVYEGTLTVVAEPADSKVPDFITASHGGPQRGQWSLAAPLSTQGLWLSEPSMEESADSNDRRTVYVDLTDI